MDYMNFKAGDTFKVMGYNCGHIAKNRLLSMGIRIGSIIKIKYTQPIKGPITIKVGVSEYSIGRGLINKIILEKME